MDFFRTITLLGGLALFLYGMTMLGSGLEKLSGGKLEKTLEKLSSNVFKAVLLGAVVTAAVQSSSATTVIIVGLVNAKMIKLRQAIGVIMGANIGTTITAHILRLTAIDSNNFFIRLFKPTTIAPIIAVVGIILIMVSKKSKNKNAGQVMLGFGILFTGMFQMTDAVSVLGRSPEFAGIFATLSNPVLGVLVGAGVTAIIQSSSASVGILQALSSTGIITCSAAFPIILGQNIGTCITPILASIGASKNAKRSAFAHLSFNVIGTTIFLIGIYIVQATVKLPFWDDPITTGGIADFHTLFNVTITLLLIPFVPLIERLVKFLVRDSKFKPDEDVGMLDDLLVASPGLAIDHARQSVRRMGELSRENFKNSVNLIKNFDDKVYIRIEENEEIIDKLESRLSIYMLKLTERELSENENRGVTELLHIMSDFERVGDYSMDIARSAHFLNDNALHFSEKAIREIDTLSEAVDAVIDITITAFESRSLENAKGVEPLEEVVDEMVEEINQRHINRLKTGDCSIDVGFKFVDIAKGMEKIADHCSSVALSVIAYNMKDGAIDRHQYLKSMHAGQSEEYVKQYNKYMEEYFKRI